MVARTLCICLIGLVAFLLVNFPNDPSRQPVDTTLVANLAADEKDDDHTKVALLDINKVFEKHARFQQRFKALGDKFKALEASAKQQSEELKRQNDELTKRVFPPGSAQLEEEKAKIAKKEADLRTAVAAEQKALADEEAKIYLETYQEIEAKCEVFAARKGISLVLRHINAEMKAGDPNSVRQGLARMVIYQKGLDITDEIAAEFRDAPLPEKEPLEPKATVPKAGEASFALSRGIASQENE
jgi:Skp family chaperone for outer membrane proteins